MTRILYLMFDGGEFKKKRRRTKRTMDTDDRKKERCCLPNRFFWL